MTSATRRHIEAVAPKTPVQQRRDIAEPEMAGEPAEREERAA
jgi:hypothetical protein